MANREHPSRSVTNWQNHNRQLTQEELTEIDSKISAVHFAKECFSDDTWTMQLLYAAEALRRELDFIRYNNTDNQNEKNDTDH